MLSGGGNAESLSQDDQEDFSVSEQLPQPSLSSSEEGGRVGTSGFSHKDSTWIAYLVLVQNRQSEKRKIIHRYNNFQKQTKTTQEYTQCLNDSF
jgi:hypothetical protein